MDGDRDGVGEFARYRAITILARARDRACRIRGLHSAIAWPCFAWRHDSDQAATRNDHGGQPEHYADGAGNLQRAECILAGLLHGNPAGAAGRPLELDELRFSQILSSLREAKATTQSRAKERLPAQPWIASLRSQ